MGKKIYTEGHGYCPEERDKPLTTGHQPDKSEQDCIVSPPPKEKREGKDMIDEIEQLQNILGELWPHFYRYDPADGTVQCKECGLGFIPGQSRKHKPSCRIKRAEKLMFTNERERERQWAN